MPMTQQPFNNHRKTLNETDFCLNSLLSSLFSFANQTQKTKMVEIFPSPEDMGVIPIIFMLVVYGFVLFNASKTISDGSEMLLLIYGPGLIGGLIIPILG